MASHRDDRSATLVGTPEDPEIELSFDFGAVHLADNKLLRDWVKTLPGASWRRPDKVWRLSDPELLPPGELKAAGFVVLRPDGQLAKRSDTIPPPIVHAPVTTTPEQLQVPAWFGLELMAYQVEGARKVASGRWPLTDLMGLGKTRQALAAAAILESERTLVICPPMVTTHWQREASRSHLGSETAKQGAEPAQAGLAPPGPSATGPAPSSMDGVDHVVVFRAGKKERPLPGAGVVIAPDSLVAARPALLERLIEWAPDVTIVDEVHREMSWTSTRSRAARRLARASRQVIPITGTPMFANPAQLVPMLAMSGQLETTFGGRSAFYSRYARMNRFGQWVPNKRHLPELRGLLDSRVWVRRQPADVGLELPELSRRVRWVDVELAEYQRHHAEVVEKIDEWLATTGGEPSSEEIDQWATGNIGVISQLRKAAGMAKVEVAAEYVSEWMAAGSGPLVVWTHHRSVTDAMAGAVAGAGGRSAVIGGGTSGHAKDKLVDSFQRGEIDVMVCQIVAAGVGITLTRSSNALFVETDWTPDLITQAEARLHRIGQMSKVMCTTLIATGTLDEHIHAILRRKIEVLNLVVPSDNGVAVERFAPTGSMPGIDEVRSSSHTNARSILIALVNARLEPGATKKVQRRRTRAAV